MSAFKLAEAFLAILISAFLWIPLAYGVDLAVTAVNTGLTDADTIAHNNQLGQLFYYTLFFIILACVIYVIKSRKGEEEDVVYYQQPTFQLKRVIRFPEPPGVPARITLIVLMLCVLIPSASAMQVDYDNFNDNSWNTSKWETSVRQGSAGSSTVTEQNQRLEVWSDTGAVYCSRTINNMTGNFTVTFKNVNTAFSNGYQSIVDILKATESDPLSNTNSIRMSFHDSDGDSMLNIYIQDQGSTVDTQNDVIDESADKYGKIQRLGSQVNFYYSTDGSSWTNFYNMSSSSGIGSDDVKIYLCSYHNSFTAYHDDFNVTDDLPEPVGASNITLDLSVDPDPLYTATDATFTIDYNNSNANNAYIEVNITVNGSTIYEYNHTSVAPGASVNDTILSGNYSKGDNITAYINATDANGEYLEANITRMINNTPPTTPSGELAPQSVIVGDNLTANVTSTDADSDAITYWYLFGYQNSTNITGWKTTDNLTILEAYDGEYIRAWFKASDGTDNGTAAYYDINVTWVNITQPLDGSENIGKTLDFAFSFRTEYYQECEEDLSGTAYPLGYINADQNHSRTIWYDENNTYTVTCYSWDDPSISYSKTINFTNYYANWSVSMYTENDWDTPLNITSANLSIFINCEGGSQYVYNFTGVTFYGVKPECDVQSISAKVDYATDSYTRERSVPDCLECDIRMYMVDALLYTVLQIPIYMSDYNYFDTRIELYKLSGGNHYTIAQGTFDVEHKYVTYLTKDNTYYIRLDQGSLGSEIRDIGYLYAASATAQYLSLSEIQLRPDIVLISDNLLMSAEFDDPLANTSTLRINYQDLINVTTSVRIRVYSDTNNTAWYDQTFYGYDNLTVSLNNVNTTRHSVRFTVQHAVLGNSPVDFTVGVGAFGSDVDFGLSEANQWILAAAGFVIMLLTALIIVPEIRIYGIIALLAELGVFVGIRWFAFAPETILFFVASLIAGIVYEIKFKGVT